MKNQVDEEEMILNKREL